MKKLFYFLIVILILSLIILNGCGLPTPVIKKNVSVNVYDKDTGVPLSDVSVAILETKLNATISGNPYQHSLAQGSYTMYLSKPGYITKGYVFNLASNLVFNVYLRQDNKNEIVSYEKVSGKVQENGSDYTGSFNIYTGDQFTADYYENLTNPFEVSSVCGNIAVSAYTKTGENLDKIAYSESPLNPGGALTGLSLELPSNPTYYSGSKPNFDQFVVKQNDGYILARQNSASSNYSFGVGLAPGDGIILESSQNDGNINYFTRIDAGITGGIHNLQYETGMPYASIWEESDSFSFYFDPASFASYYEVYAIQIKAGEGKVPFGIIVLSGNTFKISRSLFDSEADITLIYFRAIHLAGFNINRIIDGSQVYANYSYIDREIVLESAGLSSRSVNHQKIIDKIKTRVRSGFNLNYLCAE